MSGNPTVFERPPSLLLLSRKFGLESTAIVGAPAAGLACAVSVKSTQTHRELRGIRS